ncbi:RICIN domain-containing protein [Streptomyces sp. NPDC057301]|uniref:RICIN domain-containing protein n=1 Tax=Streptomyces sp. NPDC057301 TaxID=3346093 RepID=UPI00362D3EDC
MNITVAEAAALMPDVPVLFDRCRALAMVDTIGRTMEDAGYRFVPSGCSYTAGAVLRLPNVGDRSLDVHFHGDGGVLIMAWDVDADFTPLFDDCEEVWRDIVAQVPDSLRHCLWHGPDEDHAFEGCTSEGLPVLSAVMWRLPGDAAWRTARFDPPEDVEGDCALFVLGDLTNPSPSTVMWSEGLGVDREPSRRLSQAVRHVMALRPLTEEVVRTLNPDRGLADVAPAITAIGYPQDDASRFALPLDRDMGERAPLVTGAERGTSSHFFFEAYGDGYHRIFVHHSGKALEADGTTEGAAVVQAEPHDGDSQKFLVQELRGGEYHAIDRMGEDHSPTARYRILAKNSGLVLQAGEHTGDPVTLATPSGHAGQIFNPATYFGYGWYYHLSAESNDAPIMIQLPDRPYSGTIVT